MVLTGPHLITFSTRTYKYIIYGHSNEPTKLRIIIHFKRFMKNLHKQSLAGCSMHFVSVSSDIIGQCLK